MAWGRFGPGTLLSLANSHCTEVSMLCSKGYSFCPELEQFYSQSGSICPSSPAILINARTCPVPVGCSVGMGTGYGLDGSQLESHVVPTAYGVHQASYSIGSGGRGVVSSGVKRAWREAGQILQNSPEVKNAWVKVSPPQYPFVVWCIIV
jgi:hypothetical protein